MRRSLGRFGFFLGVLVVFDEVVGDDALGAKLFNGFAESFEEMREHVVDDIWAVSDALGCDVDFEFAEAEAHPHFAGLDGRVGHQSS